MAPNPLFMEGSASVYEKESPLSSIIEHVCSLLNKKNQYNNNNNNNNEICCENGIFWVNDEFNVIKKSCPGMADDHQGKRQRPGGLIDFLSCLDKPYHENQLVLNQEPESEDESLLELRLGFYSGGPVIKKRKTMAIGPPSNDPTTSGDHINLDLRRGPRTGTMQSRDAGPEPRNSGGRVWLADHWKIKKVLRKSDIDGSSRLLLARVLVQDHILPYVVPNGAAFDDAQGVEIPVWDVDTQTQHMLILKLWRSTGCYVLARNWKKDFVNRRKLMENDKIGLRWDDQNFRMEFTLINGD